MPDETQITPSSFVTYLYIWHGEHWSPPMMESIRHYGFSKEILLLFLLIKSQILSLSAEIVNKMTYKINHTNVRVQTYIQGTT